MSGPIRFEPRKTVNERLKEALTASEEQLQAVVNNEQVTRGRVDSIERVVGGFVMMSFRHRLKWLFFGWPKPKKADPVTQTEVADVQ